jgi:ATP-dependent Clp protease ATP-binding subunit ClpC
MFERFTPRARRVVVLAQEEARLLNHGYIGTEHILLGLLAEREGVAARALAALNVTLEAAREQLREIIGPGPEEPQGHIPFTPRAKKVLELSLREALNLRSETIGTGHLLLGLAAERDGVGAQILVRLDAPPAAVREKVTELAAAEPEAGSEDDPSFPFSWAASRPRTMHVRVEALAEFRDLVKSIDRRLARIERHLGLPGEEGEEEDPPAAAGS